MDPYSRAPRSPKNKGSQGGAGGSGGNTLGAQLTTADGTPIAGQDECKSPTADQVTMVTSRPDSLICNLNILFQLSCDIQVIRGVILCTWACFVSKSQSDFKYGTYIIYLKSNVTEVLLFLVTDLWATEIGFFITAI